MRRNRATAFSMSSPLFLPGEDSSLELKSSPSGEQAESGSCHVVRPESAGKKPRMRKRKIGKTLPVELPAAAHARVEQVHAAGVGKGVDVLLKRLHGRIFPRPEHADHLSAESARQTPRSGRRAAVRNPARLRLRCALFPPRSDERTRPRASCRACPETQPASATRCAGSARKTRSRRTPRRARPPRR